MTELLTLNEAARLVKVSPRTIRRHIDSGDLRAFQVAGGGTWRIRPDDLDAFLEQRANVPRPDTPRRDVTPVLAAARPRAHRRTGGVLAVTPDMGRTA